MTQDNRRSGVQLIQDRHSIVDEIVAGILLGGPARFTGAAIIVGDDQMIAAELRYLEMIPDIAGAGGFAKKQKRRAAAVGLVVDVDAVALQYGHFLDRFYLRVKLIGGFGNLGAMPGGDNPDDIPLLAVEKTVWRHDHFAMRQIREFRQMSSRVGKAFKSFQYLFRTLAESGGGLWIVPPDVAYRR